MSRTQQDQFIDDDEEETCPLCVEEFDLSDRGFRPCVCGYQICQFCYHNVRNNMNGLCPACRRPYDDANIEFRKPGPEEEALWRAKQAAKQKKQSAAAQKEAQKREADTLSRKHLAGLRVVQKNLVYVTGLSPRVQEDRLLETLRGDQYFGQYGKIVKIVVSKAKDNINPQSVGVYVTYARKQDAASCITAVDGSQNGDRVLRAQFGTTKYCSAYLRNEQCTNRNCMFLHEPGEENDSFTRQDLSSMNVISTQHPQAPSQATTQPPPQSQQPVAAAHTLSRQDSQYIPPSPSVEHDGPALPSTASWASRAPQMSRTASSRSVSLVMPKEPVKEKPKPEPQPQPEPEREPSPSPEPEEPATPSPPPAPVAPVKKKKPAVEDPFTHMFKAFQSHDFKFNLSDRALEDSSIDFDNFPSLFDPRGGAKRRAMRQREEEEDEERRRLEAEAQSQLAQQQTTVNSVEDENGPELGGSMQLGGEPEDVMGRGQSPQHAIEPPSRTNSVIDGGFLTNELTNQNNNTPNLSNLTAQQRQQLLLQQFKTPSTASSQPPFQPPTAAPAGHARNVSRYTFANDSNTASAAVKPVANAKLMNQQSSMMPSQSSFQQPPPGGFYSNVQGPPPGLKTTGTPPFSGGGMFGQGHGFATSGLGYGANLTGRNPNDEMMRDLLRSRNLGGGAQMSDAAKHISDISSLGGAAHLSSDLFDEPGRSTPPVPPGLEGLGQSLPSLDLDDEDDVPRRSTPSIPPGFTAPVIAPPKDDSATSLPTSRSSSRASLRRGNSQILPAVPVLSGTPSRAPTPLRHESRPFANIIDEFATPTKRGRSESHLANVEYAENNDTAPGAEVETPSKAELKAEKAEAKRAKRADKLAKKEAERLEKAEKAAAAAHAAAEAIAQKNAAEKLEKAAAPQAKVSETQPAPPGASKEEKTQAAFKTVDLVKDLTPAEAAAAAKSAAGETVSKKKHPGKIDITAAVLKGGEVPTSVTSTPVKAENIPRTWNTITTSRPQSPSIASDSARKVTAPRTLRLTTAVPPPAPVVAPAIRTLPATASRLPSRQPSIASIQPPGTPGSEHVSDDISVTSTSLSRANTPPPPTSSRVGSAYVRQNTKSQQKKLRQEKARQATEEILTKDVQTIVEPIQEAITSRKKKSKSAKPATPAAATPTAVTPVPSRPASPKMKAKPEEPPKVEKPATPVKVETPPPPPPAPVTPVKAPTPPPPAALTPASLIAELRSEHGSLAGAFDAFFRPFAQTVAHYKPTQQPTSADLTPENAIPPHQPELQKEDIDVLLSGNAWRPMTDEQQRLWERLVISPSGTIIRHMEPQLEERFLAMEAMNRQLPENLRFHPIQHSNTPTDVDFPAVDINVLRREFEGASNGNRHRSANAMEKAVEEGSKKGSFLVDTAGKYVNEFIMPPVPLSPPSEKTVKEEQQRDKNHIVSVEDLERRLTEARRFADDKEAGLRRLVKRNRKVIGLTH
ncbi:hypothetical protein M436DRAFT_46854 [Aureobasidium namibiae CBS 147.97]|uniref:RING-type domain-containing protein n=1 Tax=Aureobasidium namibiae CBS 147.97 TaxID=1043004 RepID=A0A074WU04_9PEZI|nr:uncharacterized protein M436DRAFT_46854 [Aureobasidium namibiae CBS 147.97]KEQ73217.1 hypothetical protein M436DRAFT_46854 [Aureobasidium namibiae CBS 147.97]